MSFRKSSVVIIDCGRRVVRGGRGVGEELLAAPSIEIQARVGLRRSIMNLDAESSSTRFRGHHFLVGAALDQAEAAGEDLEIFWPFEDPQIQLWDQVEAIWRHILFTSMQLRRTQNEYPLLLSLPPLMSRTTHERIAQICFEHLNVAGLSIFERPLMQLFSANAVSGVVIDISHNYTDIAAIVESEVQKASVTSVPIGLGTCEMYLAHTFKRNAAILKELNSPEPLSAEDLDLALLEVVRIAWAEGRIQVPHVEGSAPPPPAEEESAGIEDIAAIMVSGKEKAIIEAAAKKKTTAQEKKAAASAAEKERQALDLIDIEFDFTPKGGEERSYKVTLGKERHQLWEPLFDPTLLSRLGPALPEELKTQLEDKPLGVQEAVRGSVQSLEGKDRAAAWDGIFLTGDSSMKNLEPAFLSRLNPYLTRDPENGTQSQPIATRMLKLPEYFAEYRDKGSEIASFLGACIVAKLTFTDTIGVGKAFITKTEYGEKGPTAIRDILP